MPLIRMFLLASLATVLIFIFASAAIISLVIVAPLAVIWVLYSCVTDAASFTMPDSSSSTESAHPTNS